LADPDEARPPNDGVVSVANCDGDWFPENAGGGYLMRQFKRSQRLGMQIQRDISILLESELAERMPGLVTFTHVKLSDDLRNAQVYYSYLGKEDDRSRVDEYLMKERRRIRSQVGRNLHVKHIPELDFKFDPSVEEGMRIEKLLDNIKRERGED